MPTHPVRVPIAPLVCLVLAGCHGAGRHRVSSADRDNRIVDVRTDKGVHVRAPFVDVHVAGRAPRASTGPGRDDAIPPATADADGDTTGAARTTVR
jgi:hypothetical protein